MFDGRVHVRLKFNLELLEATSDPSGVIVWGMGLCFRDRDTLRVRAHSQGGLCSASFRVRRASCSWPFSAYPLIAERGRGGGRTRPPPRARGTAMPKERVGMGNLSMDSGNINLKSYSPEIWGTCCLRTRTSDGVVQCFGMIKIMNDARPVIG